MQKCYPRNYYCQISVSQHDAHHHLSTWPILQWSNRQRSDVFSVAILIWEILTRCVPPSSLDGQSLFEYHKGGTDTAPRRLALPRYTFESARCCSVADGIGKVCLIIAVCPCHSYLLYTVCGSRARASRVHVGLEELMCRCWDQNPQSRSDLLVCSV